MHTSVLGLHTMQSILPLLTNWSCFDELRLLVEMDFNEGFGYFGSG